MTTDSIAKYICDLPLTKGEVADRLMISRSNLYQKMRGERRWLLEEAIILAELCSVTIDELVGKKGKE